MNGFLAILAILISGLAMLPEEKRLDLTLRLSKRDILLFGLPSLTILVVVYSPVFLATAWFKPIQWIWGFNEERMVSLCIILIMIFSVMKLASPTLPKSSFNRWKIKSQVYLRNKKFHQLGYVFDRYHEQLFDIVEKKVWHVDAHNKIKPKLIALIGLDGKSKKWYTTYLNNIRARLAHLFPASCRHQDILRLSISKLLKSRQFVSFLVETHPLIAAKATKLPIPDSDEYLIAFFTASLSNTSSPLYREIRDNQNFSYSQGFYLDESNEILNFFFNDVKVAKKIGVWKPVGDLTVEYIKGQTGDNNFYNQPYDNYSQSEEIWISQIFIGIQFFDIMVSRAIYQRLDDHMWLSYLENFVDEILKLINRNPDADLESEFPTKWDYILYHIFSCCECWCGALRNLVFTEEQTQNRKIYPEYWACKLLGCLLRKILISKKTTGRQKKYFLEITLRLMLN